MFQIGASLRQARLARGLDLPMAEKATRIRLKYLQALEEERFDVLPADAYAKGFLREYAARCATPVEPAIVPPRHAEPLPLLPRPRRAIVVAVGALVLVGLALPLALAAWPD